MFHFPTYEDLLDFPLSILNRPLQVKHAKFKTSDGIMPKLLGL